MVPVLKCHVRTALLPAGFGGTFMSMAFEDPCFVYVGASGAVFGFIGLYLTDIILNWESMFRPLLRLALMLVSLGLTLGIEFFAASRNPLQ
jgi:membrane associated rhomboid family serine protease